MTAPDDLGERGQRLWDAIAADHPQMTDADAEVAVTACRTADRVERLEAFACEVEPVADGRGGPMIHPVFAEVRQQSALLARLVAALRIPDAASGKRPQRRQVRGVQQPSAVSSLDRARAKHSS